MGNGFNEWGIGMTEVTKEYLRTSVDGFCVANAMKITSINLVKILVCSPWLFIMKKIVELRREHLLQTVQNHVVECFDQKIDHWLVD